MVEQFLDQKAGDDWSKRDRMKMAAWAKVGSEHNLFFNAIARFKVPLICCFRTKDKVVIEKDENGKTKITTSEDAPIGRKDLIYEMRVSFLVEGREDGGGYWRLIKRGTDDLAKKILACPERVTQKLGSEIASWCKGEVVYSQTTPAKTKTTKEKIWDLRKAFSVDSLPAFETKLRLMKILPESMTLAKCTESDLCEVLEKLEISASEVTP